jgi:5-methylcytosine-specific restriction endonuclease McrA
MRPAILERFGMVCYLCTRPILYDTTSMHPAALTLDHVVPVTQGGRDVEENLRPAHRACNEDKGERYPTWWERRQAQLAS